MMLLIGLTGSIGMGKSTVAKFFAAGGIPVFDADAEVHALYEGEAAALIEEAFPGTTRNGKVERSALAAALLADEKLMPRLEAIVHPLVRAAREEFLTRHAQSGTEMVVLEIPLLFETGGDKQVDVSVVVSAPADVQRERVLKREGMSEAKLEALLANQMNDEEKRARADFVVDTNRSIEETAAEIDRIVESLRGREGTAYQPASTNGADK
jgi:dephospho-CoA kinase